MSNNIFKPNNALGAKLSELIGNSDTSIEEDVATIFALLHSFVMNMWDNTSDPEDVLPFMIYLIQASSDLVNHTVEITAERMGSNADDFYKILRQEAESKYKH